MSTRQMAAAGAAIVLASAGGQCAHASTLLDLVDAPAQFGAPIALEFVAEGAAVTLSVGGYQVPSFELALQNVVTLTSGGVNLLGPSWTLTRASSGSFAEEGDDNTNVPGLLFAGTTAGSYDVFSQSFATSIGSSYTYRFLYFNFEDNAPSGFRVTVDGARAVPEPGTWAMMLLGFAAIGSALRRRRQEYPKVRFNF